MKKFSQSTHSSMNELNITPLLDLAFVLLVIFIITTPQMTNDLEMNLPTPQQNQAPATPPKIYRIKISEEGALTFGSHPTNEAPIDLPELKRTLVKLQHADTNTSVVVMGSMEVNYEKVIGVLDVIQQADVTKVGLATEVAP